MRKVLGEVLFMETLGNEIRVAHGLIGILHALEMRTHGGGIHHYPKHNPSQWSSCCIL